MDGYAELKLWLRRCNSCSRHRIKRADVMVVLPTCRVTRSVTKKIGKRRKEEVLDMSEMAREIGIVERKSV